MTKPSYTFTEKMWLYPGKAAWHFISIPEDITKEIHHNFEEFSRGWGSFKVQVTIGTSEWKTSIFPDKKTGTFLLPIKASIREQEKIAKGDEIQVTIELQL